MSRGNTGVGTSAPLSHGRGAIVTFAVPLDPGHLGHDRLGRCVLPADMNTESVTNRRLTETASR